MRTNSLIIMFLSAVLIILLAACSGGSSELPAATQPETTGSELPAAAQPDATGSELAATTQPEATAEMAAAQTGEVSFAADVLPIFKQSCTRCHGSSRQSGELRLDSYAALMAGGKDGAAVIPNDAAGSLLVELISNGKMPRNAAPLPADKITLISDWINAGALDN